MTDQELKDLVASLAEDAKRRNLADAKRAEEEAERDAKRAADLSALNSTIEKLKETSEKLLRSTARMDNYIKNESLACESRFVSSLVAADLKVEGIHFDEIYPNMTKQKHGHHIQLDAMLVNGEYIGVLEVKKKLHLNDVHKVRDSLISRFKELFPEHASKRLLMLVAGEEINEDASLEAIGNGFIVLSFTARGLQTISGDVKFY